MNFKTQTLVAGVVITLTLTFATIRTVTQYLIYDAVNKGADPTKLAVLACRGSVGEAK